MLATHNCSAAGYVLNVRHAREFVVYNETHHARQRQQSRRFHESPMEKTNPHDNASIHALLPMSTKHAHGDSGDDVEDSGVIEVLTWEALRAHVSS